MALYGGKTQQELVELFIQWARVGEPGATVLRNAVSQAQLCAMLYSSLNPRQPPSEQILRRLSNIGYQWLQGNFWLGQMQGSSPCFWVHDPSVPAHPVERLHWVWANILDPWWQWATLAAWDLLVLDMQTPRAKL